MSGDRNSMLRRICSVFLVAAVPALVTIASCSGGQPDAAGNGLAPEGGPVVCSIGVEGCPCESPGQAVDCGKIKSQHATAEAATKIGAELKRKYPVIQVMIYDAVAKTRTLIEAAK